MGSELARVKGLFFTAAGVRDQVDAATRRVLSKFGAFVRRRAKSSLKYKDGAAPPGQPPHVHRTTRFTVRAGKKGAKKQQPASPLRELIYFSFEPATRSVVIGPALGGSRSGAPEKLEKGGVAKSSDGRAVVVRPRPTMRPAFEIELRRVGNDFRAVIR